MYSQTYRGTTDLSLTASARVRAASPSAGDTPQSVPVSLILTPYLQSLKPKALKL